MTVQENAIDIRELKVNYETLKENQEKMEATQKEILENLGEIVSNDKVRLAMEEKRTQFLKWIRNTVVGFVLSVVILIAGIIVRRAYQDHASIYDKTIIGMLWGEGPLNY